MESKSNGNIYKKLLALQKAVVGLTKDAKGNAGDYVSGNKLLGIVRPQMDKLGLILTKDVIECTFTPFESMTKNGPKREMFCSLKMRFTWIDVDSGESLPVVWASSGCNGIDKSIGSAYTYGERYFLLKQFGIATDKDDVDAPKTVDEEMTLQKVIAWINTLTTTQQMNEAWRTYEPYFGKDKEFKVAFTKRQKEINDGTAK